MKPPFVESFPAAPSLGRRGGGAARGTVLVTGGAGFIGSFVVDELLRRGHRVRVLDRLDPQVHGADCTWPEHLSHDAELITADCTERPAVREALAGVERVVHLAAAVGVGQSMYENEHYTRSNELGTAVLLEEMINLNVKPSRLVVASSMSIYGEGVYEDADGRRLTGIGRSQHDLENDRWEPVDARGRALKPLPTPESKAADVSSIYALGKLWQERATLITAGAYGIPAAAMRFFNVYGPRQALSNPYTGVMAIFASRLLNGNPPKVFEDGRQQRDFVSVHDVARVVVDTALQTDPATGVFNVGSGNRVTVLELADRLARILGRPDLRPEITGSFRLGDIRHCFADIGKARRELGFAPQISMDAGVDDASRELAARGLTV